MLSLNLICMCSFDVRFYVFFVSVEARVEARVEVRVEARVEVNMLGWIKALIKKYDKWCEELGLTPENKRSCVPYRRDPQGQHAESGKDDTRIK